jgi:hypothetical protein
LLLPGAVQGSLDEEEAAGLPHTSLEAKLAHDLCLVLCGQWGRPIIDRNAGSETAHMAAVARLLDLSGVENPIAASGAGTFADASPQALDGQRLTESSASAQAALSAAVLVEETEHSGLQARLDAADRPALQRAHTFLLRGSIWHRTAFSWQGGLGTQMDPTASGTGHPGMACRGMGGRRGSPWRAWSQPRHEAPSCALKITRAGAGQADNGRGPDRGLAPRPACRLVTCPRGGQIPLGAFQPLE